MLLGCVQQVFFAPVNDATARVLAAEGCDVIIPPGQGCCGALSLHGGRLTEAAAFAPADDRRPRARRGGHDHRERGRVRVGHEGLRGLAGRNPVWAGRAAAMAGKVRDFSEFLAELGPTAERAIRCPSPPRITTPAISRMPSGLRCSRVSCCWPFLICTWPRSPTAAPVADR
jgi:glycolate oxidase iron-sulfur subunit